LIGAFLARGSLTRRIATRAIVVLGAVYVGGLVMRSFPHDQILIFPVGSTFPNATRFSASWRQPGDKESRGGVTLTFATPPPLQIKQHADLPNGDYQVSIEVVIGSAANAEAQPAGAGENPQTAQLLSRARGVQTNIERRVTLAGGETVVALAVGGF
jgi:hypothetical protein